MRWGSVVDACYEAMDLRHLTWEANHVAFIVKINIDV